MLKNSFLPGGGGGSKPLQFKIFTIWGCLQSNITNCSIASLWGRFLNSFCIFRITRVILLLEKVLCFVTSKNKWLTFTFFVLFNWFLKQCKKKVVQLKDAVILQKCFGDLTSAFNCNIYQKWMNLMVQVYIYIFQSILNLSWNIYNFKNCFDMHIDIIIFLVHFFLNSN